MKINIYAAAVSFLFHLQRMDIVTDKEENINHKIIQVCCLTSTISCYYSGFHDTDSLGLEESSNFCFSLHQLSNQARF